MTCSVHGLAGTRLVSGHTMEPLCLECVLDKIKIPQVPEEEKESIVEKLSRVALSAEAQAQRLPGRLLWRTPLLQHATRVLLVAPPKAANLLIDIAAQCVVSEEHAIRSGRAACGGEVGADLLDAVVAFSSSSRGVDKLNAPTYHGTCEAQATSNIINPSLPLLARILDQLRADAASTLLDKIECSQQLLTSLIDVLLLEHDSKEVCGDVFVDAAADVVLRLAERGSEALRPYLVTASHRLSELFATVKPGSPSATSLLTLYSFCALHPERMLSCLLGGDHQNPCKLHLHRLAIGVRAHLAAPVATLQAAAASLADELMAAMAPQVTGAWLSVGNLAQWLVETCRWCKDFAGRVAAARALGYLVVDSKLLRKFHAFAADALLDACSDAATAPGGIVGGRSCEARAELLHAATESLRRLLAVQCPMPVAPERLLGLLQAAGIVEASSIGTGNTISVVNCLLPIQLSITSRPLGEVEPTILASLLEGVLAAIARPDTSSIDLLLGTLCALLQALALVSSHNVKARVEQQRQKMEVDYEGQQQHLVRQNGQEQFLKCVTALARRVSESSSRVLELAIPTIVAVMWHELEDGQTEPRPEWWKAANDIGVLVRPLLAAHGIAMDDPDTNVGGKHIVDADRLLAILMMPCLRSAQFDNSHAVRDGCGPLLIISLGELQVACEKVLHGTFEHSSSTWTAIAALQHMLWRHRASIGILDNMIPQSVMSQELPGVAEISKLPARILVYIAAATARSKVMAQNEEPSVRAVDHTANNPRLHNFPRHLCQAMISVLERPESVQEWALLRSEENAGVFCDLDIGLRWLLESEMAHDSSSLLRSVIHLEYRPLDHQWWWLASVLPAASWIAHTIVGLIPRIPRLEMPGLVDLLTFLLSQDPELLHANACSDAFGVVTMRWQSGAALSQTSALTLWFLASAPACAFGRESVNNLVKGIETALHHGEDEGRRMALQVLAFALWRHDVPGLGCDLESADLLRSETQQSVGTDFITCHMSSTVPAWTALIAALAPAVLPKDSLINHRNYAAGVGRLFLAVGFNHIEDWSRALQHSSLQVRGLSTLALAATCLRWGSTNQVELLPATSQLPSMIKTIQANITAYKYEDADCRMAKFSCSSCYLALVALLTNSCYPESLRAELLHSSDLQAPAFDSVLGSRRTGGRDEAGLSTAMLLYMLFLVRSQPRWLETSRLQPIALSVATVAQGQRCRSARRLLALRVIEAFMELGDTLQLPVCEQAVLKGLLPTDVGIHWSVRGEWAAAAGDAAFAAGASASLELLKSCEGPLGVEELHSSAALHRLHGAVIERLCACIGANGTSGAGRTMP